MGAGYAGSVCARQLAEGGKRVLVLERRDHIGGNAYDRLDRAGVLIHQYGPTSSTPTTSGSLTGSPGSRSGGTISTGSWPISRTDRAGARPTRPLQPHFAGDRLRPGGGARLGQKLIAAYGAEKTILELRQARDPEIAALADYVYEHVFVHYTMKQWGQTLRRSTPIPPPGYRSFSP